MLGSRPKVTIRCLFELLHIEECIITITARASLVECITIAKCVQQYLGIIIGTCIDKGVARLRVIASIKAAAVIPTKIGRKLSIPTKATSIGCKLTLSTKVFRSKVSTSATTTQLIITIVHIHGQSKVRIERHSQNTSPTPFHGNHMNTPFGLLLLLFGGIVQLQSLASLPSNASGGILLIDGKPLFFEYGIVMTERFELRNEWDGIGRAVSVGCEHGFEFGC
mmetsp:Transcript_21259/g.46134  ORF Transcript_21259/g.46134 Transcript_21259/m.46134 type:complete len:223 (+) Transcript_21259:1156-1824(+)